ncbi:MAG: hypothetical protein OXF06_01660 [Bacteroidetes bacterium]|nr:hypothetical protein [Bacteroidota bacterium]MCY4223516.1 hypothetical protein [Bacteroidota bacterium]
MIILFSPSGGLVFDPFVANKLGCKWLGIDMVPEYVEMAILRIDDAWRIGDIRTHDF